MIEVSVVVPTYNRRSVLQRTVECLADQAFDADRYEIVVVDDQSTDDTWEWLQKAQRQYAGLRAVRNHKKGRGQARNAGVAAAHGEIICFVDDDVWVVPGFVAAHHAAHRRWGPTTVVIGKLELCPETAKTIANEYDDARLLRVETRIASAGDRLDAGFFRTGNVSVGRVLLTEVGGFDESFQGYSYEDSELGYRLTANGAQFRYVPEAAGVHFTETTIDQVLRKKDEAGRSAIIFLTRWPEAVDRVPAPFALPGVDSTARQDGLVKSIVKSLLLSPTATSVMKGLLGTTMRLRWRQGSFYLLDWLGWAKYACAFREALGRLR